METMSRDELLQNLSVAANIIGQAEATTRKYNQLMSQVQRRREYVDIDKRLTTKGLDFLSHAAFIALAVVFGIIVLFVLLIAALTGSLTGSFFFKTVLFVAIVAVITHFIRKKRKASKETSRAYRDQQGRAQTARQNEQIDAQNKVILAQAGEVEYEIAQIRQQAARYLTSWYPPDYCYSNAVNYFIHVVKNYQASDMGKAVSLYVEEMRHQEHMAQLSQLNETTREILFTNRQMLGAIYENTAAVRQVGDQVTGAINNVTDAVYDNTNRTVNAAQEVKRSVDRGNDILDKILHGR